MRCVVRPRLGLFLNLPVDRVDGQYAARYPHLFDFFFALASITSETWIAVPVRETRERRGEYGPVEPPGNVRIAALPHWSSARLVVRRAPRIVANTVAVLIRNLRGTDAIGAVVPSVAGILFVFAGRLVGRPVFLLIRGDKRRTLGMILAGRRTRGLYTSAARAMEVPVRHWVRKGVPAFVAGDELVRSYKVPGAHVVDLYPALSRGFPFADAPRSAEDRRVGGLAFITVARLSPEKGHEDLLRACAALRRRGIDFRLRLAGDGPDRGRLERLTAELGLSDRVDYLGFVAHGPELIHALDAADVFVLPSRSEGLPHSLVEAMARGLPVIATDIGGIASLLAGGNGVVVPPRDPLALTDALEAISKDPHARGELSRSSLRAAGRFAPVRQLEDFAETLSRAYPTLSGMSRVGSR